MYKEFSNINKLHNCQLVCLIGESFLTKISHFSASSLCFEKKDLKQDLDKKVTIKVAKENNQNINVKLSGYFTTDKENYLSFIIEEKDQVFFFDYVTERRKEEHLDLCLYQDVEAKDQFTGFSSFSLIPESLPELDFDDIKYDQIFLGKKFSAPILITGMVGGVKQAVFINENLALAASKLNIPMGIGSQKLAVENPKFNTKFELKNKFPNLFLIGNLGFTDLILQKDPVSYCRKAVEMIQADALAIHINVLQECLQPEGNTRFKGAYQVIERICENLAVPILIKEVGSGLSPQTAKRLKACGVSALDVGGKGGTSWNYIEHLRSNKNSIEKPRETFRDWGIPTAFALGTLSNEKLGIPLVATGGIRNGLMIAKACAIGAQMVGIGLPLLQAAAQSEHAVVDKIKNYIHELKVSLIGTGSKSLASLNNKICVGRPFESQFKSQIFKNLN